jgi:S-DNA-T family DNA segregation ATPase FtsK/SpoIIIE
MRPEAKALFYLAASFLLFISLASFHYGQPKLNWLGYAGYSLALASNFLIGSASYLLVFFFAFLGYRLLNSESRENRLEFLYFSILLISSSMLLTVFADTFPEKAENFGSSVIAQNLFVPLPYPHTLFRYNLGGLPLYSLYKDLPLLNLEHILSPVGTTLIFSSLWLVSFLLITQIRLLAHLKTLYQALAHPPSPPPLKKVSAPKLTSLEPPPLIKKQLPEPLIQEKQKPKLKPSLPKTIGTYQLPSPDLLAQADSKVDAPTLKKDLLRQAQILEETLKSFSIDAKVGEIHCGPTITSFEVHPSIGVKVQKIKALENDIALNMQAKSIRIVAPIPGKAAVGVEVPTLHPQPVGFKELLLHYQQKSKKLQIPLLLGKGVSGEPVIADLARTPHLLIAGATGSGKSVCINTIVMSVLMNAAPSEIKLLMVDPKKVELTQYSRLPHMIAPVITEPHGAYAALNWLVKEMQTRYEILKQLGLRNISAFNARKINKEFETSLSLLIPEQMPLIVAIIDEFADLMMASSADLETPIARIAQMARAVGIHLILATQRPSREVITGIIKANIPSRIAFKVASRINSQIILDEIGAENLLGSGDCLFLPPGTSQLLRAQSPYVSDEEINRVLESITAQAPPNYLISSFDSLRTLDLDTDLPTNDEQDPLYQQALNIVLSTKVASTTFLQRKLKIGYARAASLVDLLESNGIVGPADGSKARKVLSTSSAEEE